jgi:hypothetical protein
MQLKYSRIGLGIDRGVLVLSLAIALTISYSPLPQRLPRRETLFLCRHLIYYFTVFDPTHEQLPAFPDVHSHRQKLIILICPNPKKQSAGEQ